MIESNLVFQELDDYAPEPEVHKYLHSRLMHFDVPTLYDVHYSSITLGKVCALSGYEAKGFGPEPLHGLLQARSRNRKCRIPLVVHRAERIAECGLAA